MYGKLLDSNIKYDKLLDLNIEFIIPMNTAHQIDSHNKYIFTHKSQKEAWLKIKLSYQTLVVKKIQHDPESVQELFGQFNYQC